jgi:hypothetical protein
VGQVTSPPAPMIPLAKGTPEVDSRRMAMAAVCQPLAASPLKNVSGAVSAGPGREMFGA